jgi:hypothetical protein
MDSQRIISVANLNRFADSNLNPEEEMAFAILLWQMVRATPYTNDVIDTIKKNLPVAKRSIKMAKRANCLESFVNLTKRLRILSLSIKDIEYQCELESAKKKDKPSVNK